MQRNTIYLTVEQVAQQLQVSPDTVRSWINRGQLPASKLGGKMWRIKGEDLDKYLESTKITEKEDISE